MADRKLSVVSVCVAATFVCSASVAAAHGRSHHATSAGGHRGAHHHHGPQFAYASTHHHGHRTYAYGGARVIQCVAFAKQDAGIMISGNARDWWSRAAGVYERGYAPEEGSVLAFRPVGRMPLGHVAVVSGVEDSRTILIDQSHWNSRGITRSIEVKDVSDRNDWSAVRVQLTHGGAYGSIYPTHGFIYPRPSNGDGLDVGQPEARVITASAHQAVTDRPAGRTAVEIAEAPAPRGHAIDLNVSSLSFDAPNRALR